eukprot:5619636-Prorocentrum_lima.AAC.1
MTLLDELDDSGIAIDLEDTTCTRALFAFKVHTNRGSTTNKPYSSGEYDKAKHDIFHIALPRTSKQR